MQHRNPDKVRICYIHHRRDGPPSIFHRPARKDDWQGTGPWEHHIFFVVESASNEWGAKAPKFKIALEKWWLEDDPFPFGMVNPQGRTVKLPGSKHAYWVSLFAIFLGLPKKVQRKKTASSKSVASIFFRGRVFWFRCVFLLLASFLSLSLSLSLLDLTKNFHMKFMKVHFGNSLVYSLFHPVIPSGSLQ